MILRQFGARLKPHFQLPVGRFDVHVDAILFE